MIYLQLLYEFFKTGLFAFGGGLATLPFLEDIGVRTGWFTPGDLLNMIAISEATPGPIGINMATYVGFHTAGIFGAVIATLALILPAIGIVLTIARFLSSFKENRIVEATFYGLRAASMGLIAAAGFSVLRSTLLRWEMINLLDRFHWTSIALTAAVLYAIRKWKLHPIAAIGISAVIGMVLRMG